MTQVERMRTGALLRFLKRAYEASEKDALEPCEHGHVECSDREGGACLDEALRTPVGRDWSDARARL